MDRKDAVNGFAFLALVLVVMLAAVVQLLPELPATPLEMLADT